VTAKVSAPAAPREYGVNQFANQFADHFAAFGKNGARATPPWLPALRQRAFDRFRELGFPTTRDEDWHYTSVAPIAESVLQLAKPPASLSDARALTPFLIGGESGRLVFVNGRFVGELSSFVELPADIEVSTLSESLATDEAFVERHLGSMASIERSSFAALNTAFISDGVVARIPDECVIERPIHVLWLTDGSAAGSAVFPRLLLVAGRESRVALIETYAGLDANTAFTNAVTEIRLGDGAHVEHYRVQRESVDAFHVGTVQASQGRGSVFHSFSFAAGARLSRANIYTALAEPGAEARLNGLYLLDGHQHCDHQTFVHHAAEQCTSRELYKGILDDDSRGVFNGKVLVDPVAQKTDGKQTNHALLLSEGARVDTKPQLEIFADDVKCTHGATVGRLDETTLFYLKSRGIHRDTARALLTYAFAAEAISTIEVPALRDSLQQLAFDRYNQPRKA
jgi:Fe-S cluster assembly protein SufD